MDQQTSDLAAVLAAVLVPYGAGIAWLVRLYMKQASFEAICERRYEENARLISLISKAGDERHADNIKRLDRNFELTVELEREILQMRRRAGPDRPENS